MKARPILMHARSIQNLLAGRKSQTRRIVKEPLYTAMQRHPPQFERDGGALWLRQCPYGNPGDLLYVKEAFCCGAPAHPSGIGIIPAPTIERGQKIVYRASSDFGGDDPPWRPSIHCPRWASRLTLELVSVRVERVQDIEEYDAIDEGVEIPKTPEPYRDACGELVLPHTRTARDAFRSLWNDTNGPGAWERNDWCWALTFRVHRANVDHILHLARGGVIKASQPYLVGERPAEETSPPWPRLEGQ